MYVYREREMATGREYLWCLPPGSIQDNRSIHRRSAFLLCLSSRGPSACSSCWDCSVSIKGMAACLRDTGNHPSLHPGCVVFGECRGGGGGTRQGCPSRVAGRTMGRLVGRGQRGSLTANHQEQRGCVMNGAQMSGVRALAAPIRTENGDKET